MKQEELAQKITHDDKVQIIFNAAEQLYGAKRKPTEELIWLLVKDSGISKEDVHSYTWHLREEEGPHG